MTKGRSGGRWTPTAVGPGPCAFFPCPAHLYILEEPWLQTSLKLTTSVYFYTTNYPFNLQWFIFRGFPSTSLTARKSACLIFLPFIPLIKHSGLCYLGGLALLECKWEEQLLIFNSQAFLPLPSFCSLSLRLFFSSLRAKHREGL